MQKFLLMLLIFHGISTSYANLNIYPKPSGVRASSKFQVYVKQGHGAKQPSFTYITTSDNRVHESNHVKPHRSISWTSFSFTGSPVIVEVHTPKDFRNCIVRPKSYNFKCHRTSLKVAQFTITSNTKMMSIEFDYDYGSNHADITDKLLVFADAPETNVPSHNAANVLYYGPGVHDLGGQKQINGHTKEIYLAPGAFIHGGFKTTGSQSVKIHGRGIISGERYKFHDTKFDWASVNMDKGSHHILEGVTIVDPTQYFYRALSDHNTVRNVKMVGPWTYNSDGVATGTDGVVEDTFIMANDDSVKVYNDDMVVRRSVIWQSQNGAVFQFGWWSSRDLHHVRISDIDIIHTDWCSFKRDNCHISENDAVLNIGGNTQHLNISDIEISDVRIEGSCPRVIYFKAETGSSGSVSGVRLVNWSIDAQPTHDSLHNELSGQPKCHFTNWQFTNFKIGGHCISKPMSADFLIDGHTVSNYHFSCQNGNHVLG